MGGFLSGLLGGGKANTSALDKKQQELLSRQSALEQMLLSNYQNNAQAGAYDPTAQLDQLKADTAYQSGINSGNAAASAKILGYRPGDSEPLLRQAAQSRASELAYGDAANQIRSNAVDRGSAAISNVAGVGSGILSSGISGYANLAQQRIQEAQQPSGFASLLGAVTPFLMPQAAPFAIGKSLLGGTNPNQLDSRPGSFIRSSAIRQTYP